METGQSMDRTEIPTGNDAYHQVCMKKWKGKACHVAVIDAISLVVDHDIAALTTGTG